jgi:hypothetical protein
MFYSVGLAVSAGGLVGLDAESACRKTRGDPLRLARRRFSRDEVEDLQGEDVFSRESASGLDDCVHSDRVLPSWLVERRYPFFLLFVSMNV